MHEGTMQITMLDFFRPTKLKQNWSNGLFISHLQTMYIYNVYINAALGKNVLRTLFQRIYQLHLIFFYIQHFVLKI